MLWRVTPQHRYALSAADAWRISDAARASSVTVRRAARGCIVMLGNLLLLRACICTLQRVQHLCAPQRPCIEVVVCDMLLSCPQLSEQVKPAQCCVQRRDGSCIGADGGIGASCQDAGGRRRMA